MEKVVCEKCNKKFSSNEALDMHNRAKHSEKKEEHKSVNPKKKKKAKKWTLSIIILALIVLGIYYLRPNTADISTDEGLLNINLKQHTNLALHFHPFLEIEILGEKQIIPANMGISSNGMKIVHTHDNSGELHVESPTKVDIYLRHFFMVWGRAFNSSCIFDYCIDEDHTLKVYANGIEDDRFENILLKDGDKIRIVYEEK